MLGWPSRGVYRVSSARQQLLIERADTLETETLHWRQRCALLRDRCAELGTRSGACAPSARTSGRNWRARQARQAEAGAHRPGRGGGCQRGGTRGARTGAARGGRAGGAPTLPTAPWRPPPHRPESTWQVADQEGRWLHQNLSVVSLASSTWWAVGPPPRHHLCLVYTTPCPCLPLITTRVHGPPSHHYRVPPCPSTGEHRPGHPAGHVRGVEWRGDGGGGERLRRGSSPTR